MSHQPKLWRGTSAAVVPCMVMLLLVRRPDCIDIDW